VLLNGFAITRHDIPISIGTKLGSPEITALLGKGGMGEVYRARDMKLKRDVAIKILPEEFSRDADRVSRFQREAEVLASVNHPNIWWSPPTCGSRTIRSDLFDWIAPDSGASLSNDK
jgi:serine/threonine protein kinase